MRKVAHIMGMPVSIDIPDSHDESIIEKAFAFFRSVDERFSPFKKDSEVSRYIRGEVKDKDVSREFAHIQEACKTYEKETDGYFSATFAGHYNPTGYVKGWAIQQVGHMLESHGIATYMINAGGDILARSKGSHTWHIGLQHPRDKQAAMGTITAHNIAVATSGDYVRGNHILDPHTGKPVAGLTSCTVIGPDIAAADVYATAVFAMGEKGVEFIKTKPGYRAILVTSDLQIITSED